MSGAMGSGLAIEARAIVRRYGALAAIDGLDIAVPRGSCQGLLGPNGAGKTTTVNMLVGLDTPDLGEIGILGMRWAHDAERIQQAIGVQLQETTLIDKLTVCELLRLFRSFYREGRELEEIVGLVGLEEKRNTHYKNLSGGQRQRLALGCALVNRPDVLFLDEPTTGLDPQARRRVWEIVEDFKQAGGTVLLTTHYMQEAEQLCDHVVIIDHGKAIAEGSPRQIIASLEAESLVEFTLLDGVRLSARQLETLPGVLRVRAVGQVVSLYVSAPHETLPVLLQQLAERGVGLGDLTTHRPTLEDVFVSLTGRHLRDG